MKDGQVDWGCISTIKGAAQVCRGNEGTEPEAKTFDLSSYNLRKTEIIRSRIQVTEPAGLLLIKHNTIICLSLIFCQ